MDAIVIRGVHDVATDTSPPETKKLEGTLDALVNLVTKLVANQKHASLQESAASVLPMTTILVSVFLHRRNLECMSIPRLMLQTPIADPPQQFSVRNDAIVIRGIHDVVSDTSTETRKLEGKLDALVNLVTQLAVNQKHSSVAKVCDICSSNGHHTSVCPSSRKSGIDEHPEAYATNT
ncbi:hypothetical protein Fmac_028641 [Flemingia macrophylla]|uniref:Uncharacterized protein n=1 Tax=Flemingia macrophylla TaxID=520843 RepID=A0ABD1L832_9FABA